MRAPCDLSPGRSSLAREPLTFLSWGCPKISPPPGLLTESTPGNVAVSVGMARARRHPRSALAVFTASTVYSSGSCRDLHPAPVMGFGTFPRASTGPTACAIHPTALRFPAPRSCPSKPFSPATAASFRSRGSVTVGAVADLGVHRLPCPLAACPSSPSRVWTRAASRPCSIAGAVPPPSRFRVDGAIAPLGLPAPSRPPHRSRSRGNGRREGVGSKLDDVKERSRRTALGPSVPVSRVPPECRARRVPSSGHLPTGVFQEAAGKAASHAELQEVSGCRTSMVITAEFMGSQFPIETRRLERLNA